VRTVWIITVSSAALAALTACADTGTTQAQQQPGTQLTVSLRTAENATPTTWELSCDPAGGTHPDPEAACRALSAAADPFAAPPTDEMCTEIYGGPERAIVEGTWRGQPIRAEFSRANGCEIARFDALRPVLQP
jgi:hypothetical protein